MPRGRRGLLARSYFLVMTEKRVDKKGGRFQPREMKVLCRAWWWASPLHVSEGEHGTHTH